jgi:hypothetical protein
MSDIIIHTNTLPVLERAREILSEPTHWTKDEFALTEDLTWVDPINPEAFCFCALGALRRAESDLGMPPRSWGLGYARPEDYLEAVIPEKFHQEIPTFNDSDETDHEDVLYVFDVAIEDARAAVRAAA